MQTRLLAVATAIALLAACSPAQPTPTSTPPTPTSPTTAQTPTPTPSPTPSPTPTPTPTVFPSFPADLPTEDPEVAAIIKGWQEYWRVFEKFAAAPEENLDLTETQYVTTGEEASRILIKIDQLRELRLRSEGGFIFRNVQVKTADASTPTRTALILYCLDRSKLQLFNLDTGDFTPSSGTLVEQATLVQMEDGRWVVSDIDNDKKSC